MYVPSLVAVPLLCAMAWSVGALIRRWGPPPAPSRALGRGIARGVFVLRAAGRRERRLAEHGARSVVELPAWVIAVAVAVLATNTLMAVVGAIRIGVNVDEPVHLLRLASWFETGWYLPSFYMDGEQPASSVTDTYVYAPVAMLAAHALTVLVGVEAWGEVQSTSTAYAARHVVFSLIAMMGAAAVAATTRLLLGSWRWAVIAAAMTSAIPLWTGHAMFNVKDTPAASGVAIAFFGLVTMSQPGLATSRRLRWASTLSIGCGTFLAVGVRPGVWPVIALGGLVMLALTTQTVWRSEGPRTAFLAGLVRAGLSAVGVAGGYSALVGLYPNAFRHPVRLLRSSLAESTDFVAWDGWVITAGIGHGVPSPWWYVPAWIGHQIPVAILALSLGGLIVVASTLHSEWRTGGQNDSGADARPVHAPLQLVGGALVAVLATAGPVAAMIMEVRLQSGVRQLLFIVPGIATLATVGLWGATLAATRRSRAGLLVALVACAALVLPTIDQLRLFPYNYVYFNEFADLQGVDGRWATDSLRTSFREIASMVDPEGEAICSAHPSGDRATSDDPIDAERARSFWACDSFPSFGVYSSRRSLEAATAELAPGQFWLVRENQFGSNVPRNCTLVAEVDRPLRVRSVTMSYVALCDPPDALVGPDVGTDGS